MSELVLRNRQQVRAVNLRHLRRIAGFTLNLLPGLQSYELGVHLVGAREMTALNETFLGHAGSTDVLSFDHAGPGAGAALQGELFICLDDAVAQARDFGTTWQAEVVRYLVHGLLHLRGHDDLDPAARRRMRRAENRLVSQLARQFDLDRLNRRPNREP